MTRTNLLGPLIAMLGSMDAPLTGLGNAALTSREDPPTIGSGRHINTMKAPRYGARKCGCGRTISANKDQCAKCAGVVR